ncbi:hypothetical protein QTO34_005082 [Cnephaeus nilssonii]|uniref:Uncharacterized protein n=1 Tax=Cnephaeus nilssonii TaxID=3371016 RepID=A0AA40LJ19_CNENI|nr:hypothetical protein QTO34_005082 [Eptesicus nilssonii]
MGHEVSIPLAPRAFEPGHLPASRSSDLPRSMAPKRQPSLPPQTKKPKVAPAPKPERKPTPPDVPKGALCPKVTAYTHTFSAELRLLG